jgi:hypothetical protein
MTVERRTIPVPALPVPVVAVPVPLAVPMVLLRGESIGGWSRVQAAEEMENVGCSCKGIGEEEHE